MSSGSIILSNKSRRFTGEIQLTGSKSESNRALILQALSDGKIEIRNLSSAADTVTLDHILKSQLNSKVQKLIDIGPAGTAMRFLTAYCAVKELGVTLTGSARMKQRPIGILVDALRTLGCKIEYPENDGFPPIKVKPGFEQQTKYLSIQGDISSQYITALLLVAPSLPKGLELEIIGELTSRPYVEMTLSMMKQCGINYNWTANKISISSQQYGPGQLTIEPDWSAASYWYSIAALSQEAEIKLPYLHSESLQGDSRIAEIMTSFGIRSIFEGEGLCITRNEPAFLKKSFDLKDCPDLAQTVIVCCAALGYEASFTGLETLKIKETDRIKGLQNELAKIGVKIIEDGLNYHLDCSALHFPEKINIKTYEDHRMAMAFAPLALLINEVEIEDPDVVAKSYPHFWNDLETAGFDLAYST